MLGQGQGLPAGQLVMQALTFKPLVPPHDVVFGLAHTREGGGVGKNLMFAIEQSYFAV